jgi:thioesterase domain-containing protein/acyl carrier protein
MPEQVRHERDRLAPRQIRISCEAEADAELRAAVEQVAMHAGEAAKIVWHEYDLRDLPIDLAEKWFASFLETDRKQKLRSERALGTRCSCVIFAENRAELVWSFHPALMPNGRAQGMIDEIVRLYGRPVTFGEVAAPLGVEETEPVQSAERSSGQPIEPSVQATAVYRGALEEEEMRKAEQQLTEIWKIVIGRQSIGRDEDFFEAGGHSLSAARLLAHIEKTMGVEVPLAALLESPTIAHQAGLIYKAQKEARRSKASQGTDEAAVAAEIPLFFLAGDATFRPLVKRLSALRKLHSLGLQSWMVEKSPQPTLQEIASDFVAEVIRREPSGLIALGGWCAHGILALEVAQQLKEQGRETAHLVMLETSNPVALKVYSPWRRFISRQQLKLHLLEFERIYLSQLNKESAREYVRGRLANKISTFRRLFGANDENGHGKDQKQLLEALYRAAAEYVPARYEGRALLIRSTERTLGFASDERLGWSEALLPNLEVQRVPGNHYTIYMPPNADDLAKTAHQAISRAESAVREQPYYAPQAVAFPSQRLHYSAASGLSM